jgi:hypothetical protein
MAVSPISLGISTALAIMGLRGLWKLQHRLDFRGYFMQGGLIFLGFLLTFLGFYMPKGTFATVFFIYGVVSIGAFLLFPEIVYRLLRLYDHIRAGGGSER